MPKVYSSPLPADSLLRPYAGSDAYVDCYTTEIAGSVSHAEFVEAFYTSWLFKLERFILRCVVARPSTDTQVKQLANGSIDLFAAWSVEARAANQLLLCDYLSRTRSWLMVSTTPGATAGHTRLYFGSAVVTITGKDGERKLGIVFDSLTGFHKLYSRLLLGAARSRLHKTQLKF